MPRSPSPGGATGPVGAPWIPLRDDYFETPLLSNKERAYLVRKACEAAQEVVERARSVGGPVQWRHMEKYNDVQLYAGFSRGTYSAEPGSMCGVTSVPGSIKEVAALFDLSSTRAMKEFARENRDLFFDAVVLYSLSPRTKEKPLHQVTAKWVATQCPKGLDNRDYCYLECQDKFIDSTGRKGWVMCLHSIKLPGCDELSREFGFVRGSFYHSGVVVVESDRPGFVDVIHMLQVNFKNNTKVPPAYLRERVAWISRIKTILRTRRLNEQRYLSDLELVPKKYRSRCNVCQDSFSLLLLRKMNCRKCGEVVCGACSKEFDVTNAKFLETVKLRICMHCFQMITSGQMPSGSVLDGPRASTTVSLLGYYDDNQRASVITQVPHGQPDRKHGQTRIILQSMRHQHSADRRSRQIRGTEPGYRMQMPPGPAPMSHDSAIYAQRVRSSTRIPPVNTHNGVYGYDPRSVFDAPRNDPHPPPPPPPQVPPPPASLFDRRSTRIRMDDLDLRRSEEVKHRSNHVPLASMKSSVSPRTSMKQRPSTRESRGAFKIPHSLYDYSSMDPDATQNNEPPRSPTPPRRDSTSSVSSTGSIDIDLYEVGKAPTTDAQTGTASAVEGIEASMLNDLRAMAHANEKDGNDTEGSVGSGEEDEESGLPFQQRLKANIPVSYYEDEEEESKTQEYESTPALPPPSPSAFLATHDALLNSGRESMDVPFKRRNFNMTDLSVNTTNTADCDVNYLDTEMRQFHGQPFYMRIDSSSEANSNSTSDRATFDIARVNESFMEIASESSAVPSVELGGAYRSRSSTTASSTSGGTAVRSVTSPEKSSDIVSRPPLYGRPKPKESRASPQFGAEVETLGTVSPSERADSSLFRTFELNTSLLSAPPLTHSNEDLTFKDDPTKSSTSSNADDGRRSLESPRSESFSPAVGHAASHSSAHSSKEGRNSASSANAQDLHGNRSSTEGELTSLSVHMQSVELNEKAMSHTNEGRGNQEEIDDVDFEELLRMTVSNQEDEHDLTVDDEDFEHRLTVPAEILQSHVMESNLHTFGAFPSHKDSDDESDDRDLLSARRMFRKFGSTKNLEKAAGVTRNPTFQRAFSQIQESIQNLSDSEDEDIDWSDEPRKRAI